MANTYTLIEAKTLASAVASVTFSSIPQTYTDIKCVFSVRTDRSSFGSYCFVSFNGSSSNFSARFIGGDGSSAASGTQSQLAGIETDANATANTFNNTELYVPNYISTTNAKSYSVDSVSENNGSTAFDYLVAGLWNPATQAAITSLGITAEAGANFVSGSTFYLYGISNS